MCLALPDFDFFLKALMPDTWSLTAPFLFSADKPIGSF
jgi:hypothetical protein